jgi:hypothetical protein
MVLDGDFANSESASRSEHRDESMHFAIQGHFLKHLIAVSLKAAIEIVQRKS